ncbi:MAG: FlgD immunoglobulin-like domain containing protein, partial [Bacteroidota bacterium]
LVTLEIYNILGEKVRTLINAETYQAGYFSVVWDGRDNLGRVSPSGIYFYRIAGGDQLKTMKMILTK